MTLLRSLESRNLRLGLQFTLEIPSKCVVMWQGRTFNTALSGLFRRSCELRHVLNGGFRLDVAITRCAVLGMVAMARERPSTSMTHSLHNANRAICFPLGASARPAKPRAGRVRPGSAVTATRRCCSGRLSLTVARKGMDEGAPPCAEIFQNFPSET